MAWVREDDRELLDPRIGALRPLEYVELHALRQYVAREHPGAGGIFHRSELGAMAYLSPRGARAVSPKTLARLIQLGLVRDLASYSEKELRALEEDERTNRRYAYQEAAQNIRDALASTSSEGRDELRPHRWEVYNGHKDRTVSERMSRYRAGLRGEDTGSVTRNDTAIATGSDTRASSRPVPVVTTTPTSESDGETDRTSDDLVFPSIGGVDAGQALDVVRLLAAVGQLEPAKADMLRGYASRAPEAVLARILERFADGDVDDRYGYAVGTLKRELGS